MNCFNMQIAGRDFCHFFGVAEFFRHSTSTVFYRHQKTYLFGTNHTSLPPLTIDFQNGYRSLLEGLLPSEYTNLHCYLLIVASIHVRG